MESSCPECKWSTTADGVMEGKLTTTLSSCFVNKINGAVDIVSETRSNFEHGTKTKRSVYEKIFRQSSQLLRSCQLES